MKKILLLVTLLSSISLVSMATTVPAKNSRKPNMLYHFTHCGQDTYAYGATEAEMWQTVNALVEAYCMD